MYYSNVRSSKGLSIDEKRLKYHLELQSHLETWELCSDHNNLTTVVHRSFSSPNSFPELPFHNSKDNSLVMRSFFVHSVLKGVTKI